MNKTDLLPGDILLLVDEPTNTTTTHKLIKTGQKMVPGLQGASELVHAVIWVRDPTNAEPWEIAEASGSGRVRVTSLRQGLYRIYRPADTNLSDWAAQVAMMWAAQGEMVGPDTVGGNVIGYSKPTSVFSIVHSKKLGSSGSGRAVLYAKDAFSNSPEWGPGGAFCSQFVIACYQAAAGNLGVNLTGFLATDAKHCSVRALEHQMLTDTGVVQRTGTDLRIS